MIYIWALMVAIKRLQNFGGISKVPVEERRPIILELRSDDGSYGYAYINDDT